MPQWLAYLTAWLEGATSDSDAMWKELVTRYVRLASRWHVLDAEDWRRLDYAVRAVCLKEAMRHTQDEKTLRVCKHVLDLCDQEAQGERVDAKTWSDAAWSADALESGALFVVSKAPFDVLAKRTMGVASTAWAASSRGSGAASRTASRAAYRAAYSVEDKNAIDRIIAVILDTIEQSVSQKT